MKMILPSACMAILGLQPDDGDTQIVPHSGQLPKLLLREDQAIVVKLLQTEMRLTIIVRFKGKLYLLRGKSVTGLQALRRTTRPALSNAFLRTSYATHHAESFKQKS